MIPLLICSDIITHSHTDIYIDLLRAQIYGGARAPELALVNILRMRKAVGACSMEFDDSLFLSDEASGTGSVDDGEEKANEVEGKKATEPVYIPKNCPPEVKHL